MIASQVAQEVEPYCFGESSSGVCAAENLKENGRKSNDSLIIEKSNGVQNEARHVVLNGVAIVSLIIDGQERLCLAQISNTLLKEFSYNEIHNRRVALGITCVQCTPVQLEILRRAGAMPISSRRCGMITKREAERLCKSFLCENEPPKLPDDFAFDVYHACAWGSRGCFIPSRYNSSRAKCIRCSYCNLFFSPNKFIFHSHRLPISKYVQPDAANFNSWRRHIKLSDTSNDDINFAWEDVKAMFNGGSRKRVMSSSINSATRAHMSAASSVASKKSRCEQQQQHHPSIISTPPPQSSINSNSLPTIPAAPLAQRFDKSPYFPMLPFPGKAFPMGSAPCFQSAAAGMAPELVWNKNVVPPTPAYPQNLSSIFWSSNHGPILSTTLLQKSNLTPTWPGYPPPPDVSFVDFRSAVGMYKQNSKISKTGSPETNRSAFKPVNKMTKNFHMNLGDSIKSSIGGVEPSTEHSRASDSNESVNVDYKSDSDIDVNDSSDGNQSPLNERKVENPSPRRYYSTSGGERNVTHVENDAKSTHLISNNNNKITRVNCSSPESDSRSIEIQYCSQQEVNDRSEMLRKVPDKRNEMQLQMKIVRDNFFQRLEEERVTRIAVQQKLKEAHEALHKVSCTSLTCNCKATSSN